MIAVVSRETGDVDTATDAVDDPGATVTDAGIATPGPSLVNATRVGADAGAVSVIVTVDGDPPFTARGSTAMLTNEPVDDVGSVGDSGEFESPPQEIANTAIKQRQRPLSTTAFSTWRVTHSRRHCPGKPPRLI